jgi:glycosyltransferase involved in cell wall biosynthesis
LLEYYGEKAFQDGRDFLLNQRSTQEMAARYHLIEWALERAHGVVVHDDGVLRQIRPLINAPAVAVELPYASADRLPVARPMKFQGQPGEKLQLVLFGFLQGENRRLVPFLEALAAFPQKERCRLTIAGEVPDKKLLTKTLKRLNIDGLVHVEGFLSEPALDGLIADSDLAINLRFPSRGESSGSLLRIWSHARPCLVTKTAWYARRPAGTVAWVRPEEEVADLHQHLQGILDNPERYREIGLAGRRELENRHTPGLYAQAIMALLFEVQGYRKQAFIQPYLTYLSRNPAISKYLAEPAAPRICKILTEIASP